MKIKIVIYKSEELTADYYEGSVEEQFERRLRATEEDLKIELNDNNPYIKIYNDKAIIIINAKVKGLNLKQIKDKTRYCFECDEYNRVEVKKIKE